MNIMHLTVRKRQFLYGTLMKGQRAEHLIGNSECLGLYLLKDYAMYDLDAYPGIVAQKGFHVIGEVYRIPADLMETIDRYEGEGSLYHRVTVPVTNYEGTVYAKTYVYNGTPQGRSIAYKWNADESDRIWYAAYGSSLSRERFNCYIYGGFADNNRDYEGCWTKPYGLTAE